MTTEEIKTINATVASNIRRFLEESGKTKKDLARFVGVSSATITYWCTGERTPRMDKIDRMCVFFSCTRADLIDVYNPDSIDAGKLTPEENELILKYRSADKGIKSSIKILLGITDDLLPIAAHAKKDATPEQQYKDVIKLKSKRGKELDRL